MDATNMNVPKPPSPRKDSMNSNASAPVSIPVFNSPALPDRTMSSASSSSGGGANSQPCPMECDDSASSTNDSACNMNSANNLSELDDTEIEDEDEKRDEVGNMPDELWSHIRDEKKKMNSMFVSGWEEEDDEGVQEKDMTDPKEQFLTAAEEGDLEKLKRMFHQRPEYLHVRDQDNYTPLHRAAYNNHVNVCRWLLSVGADPELMTENGWTVLHCAACWANYDIVGVLLSHGVNVNSRSHGNLTPLHLAINSSEDPTKQYSTVKYLLEAPGIDMSAVTGAGDTPLMLARRVSPVILELLQHHLGLSS